MRIASILDYFSHLIARVVLVGLLLGGTAYFLLETDAGLRFFFNVATSFVPGKLRYLDIHGSLLHNITVSHLIYEHEGITVDLEKAKIDWDLSHLRQQLIVHDLDAKEIKITNSMDVESKGNQNPRDLLKWLAYLNVQHANITNLQYNNTTIKQLTLDNHTLLIDTTAGVITGTYHLNFNSGLQWQANLTGLKIQPGAFVPGLEGNVDFHAITNGDVNAKTFQFNVDKFQGKLREYPVNGVADISYVDNQLKIDNTKLTMANATSQIAGEVGNNWNIRWQIAMPQLQALFPKLEGSISSTGTITGSRLRPTIKAKVQGDNFDYVNHAEFNLEGNIRLAENIVNSLVNVQLSEGKATIPKMGLTVSNIRIEAHNKEAGPIALRGDFMVDKSQGNLAGTIDLAKSELPLQLHISGENLQIINLKEYKVTVTPDINLAYDNEHLRINGKVDVPSADIAPADFNDVVTLPNETEIISDKAQPNIDLPLNLSLQLQINLGKHIFLSYDHLKAELGGNIAINQTPNTVATATGELYTTKGTYKTYGRELTIQNGRIIYSGNSLTNPGLDISAIRTVKTVVLSTGNSKFTQFTPTYTGNQTIQVGIAVKGTVRKPLVTLFSDATLSQEDILSYIVFGRPRSEISGTDAIVLLNGIALNSNSMADNSFSSLVSYPTKIIDKLGLSEFGLGTTDMYNPDTNAVDSTTTFNIGKQFGDRLYVHYSVGLTSSLQVLNLRFQINKHFSIQSETSPLENGADIFYVLER